MSEIEHTTARIERCLLAVAIGQGRTLARNELLQHSVRRIREMVRREMRRHQGVARWEQEEDLVQEVLIRVDRAVQDAKPEHVGQFFVIVAQHVRWATVDLIRRYFGPMGTASRHQTGELPLAQAISGEPARHGESDSLLIHEAVDDLADDLREPWLLYVYAGLTQIVIADLLGVSTKTVQRRLTEAKLKLSEALLSMDLTDPA